MTKVLLTHGHVDHASAAGTMADHYGVKIEGPHKDDLFLIEGLPDFGRKYNFPAYKPFVPDRWLEGGETVSLGNLTFDVVHCPGHTPGHVVFVHKPAKVAFVGDVLFRGSIGRTDFPRGNHEQLAELDPQAALAARRRYHLRARPRPDLDLRLGTQDQFLRRRPVVRRRRRGSGEGLAQGDQRGLEIALAGGERRRHIVNRLALPIVLLHIVHAMAQHRLGEARGLCRQRGDHVR